MIENTILEAKKEGRRVAVFSINFPSLYVVELAAHVGFDAINLDGEHGAFSPEAIDDICRCANALNMSVTARVPNISPQQINIYLDRGVQGITGPHIESRTDALQLVNACLFPPAGERSWGGGRGTEFNDDEALTKYGGKLGFAEWSNNNMIVIAQIESKPAYDNLDEILSVAGLTGITGGPNDFAASLGYPGQPDHPTRVAATEDADWRARAAGKVAGGDLGNTTGLAELMLGAGREFVKMSHDPVR